ncbi:hypothetical protein CG736_35100 [Kitasatospora sp. CB02891]|nr:hypothetical protein CG736_35100 [Kitasatospora sp. CB02891]
MPSDREAGPSRPRVPGARDGTPREPFAVLRRSVSPPELFFDLVSVFVFAVGRLAEHLLAKLSWRGAAETAVTLAAVLNCRALTSFDAAFPDVGLPRTRWLVLTVTGPGCTPTPRSPTRSPTGPGPSPSRRPPSCS